MSADLDYIFDRYETVTDHAKGFQLSRRFSMLMLGENGGMRGDAYWQGRHKPSAVKSYARPVKIAAGSLMVIGPDGQARLAMPGDTPVGVALSDGEIGGLITLRMF